MYIINERKNKSITISIDYNGLNVCCHFFCVDEIEFDISPRDSNNEMKAEAVLEFMKKVSALLNKNVLILIENDKVNPLLTVINRSVYKLMIRMLFNIRKAPR
jgi:hypothetical protein